MPGELKLHGLAIHSNRHLQLLRGKYKEKAKAAVYEIIGLTDRSATVRPRGSQQTYGTQFPREYLTSYEAIVTAEQDLFCRFCQQPITKDTPGAVPDIDPVTNEHSGYRHEACQPDFRPTDSSTPTHV